MSWALVALLGGVGAVARFEMDAAVRRFRSGPFPFGILLVNVSGAFALGALHGAGVTGNALLYAGTGALGAYTTFSAWMTDTHRLAWDGLWRLAALNLVLSLGAGLAAAELGRLIA